MTGVVGQQCVWGDRRQGQCGLKASRRICRPLRFHETFIGWQALDLERLERSGDSAEHAEEMTRVCVERAAVLLS